MISGHPTFATVIPRSKGGTPLRSPMSIEDKSYARDLGCGLLRRRNFYAAWAMFRRYDDLVILESVRRAQGLPRD